MKLNQNNHIFKSFSTNTTNFYLKLKNIKKNLDFI